MCWQLQETTTPKSGSAFAATEKAPNAPRRFLLCLLERAGGRDVM